MEYFTIRYPSELKPKKSRFLPKQAFWQEHDRWRYRYPEFGAGGIRAKVPSRELSDALIESMKNE